MLTLHFFQRLILLMLLQDTYNQKLKNKITTVTTMEQPFWIPMTAGAVARIWAATIVSPLELIRTKMQSQKLSYAGTYCKLC